MIGLTFIALASVVRINSREFVVCFGAVLTYMASMFTFGFTTIF